MLTKQEVENINVTAEELSRIIDEIEEDKENQRLREELQKQRMEEQRYRDEQFKQREIERLRETVNRQQEQLDRMRYERDYGYYRDALVSDKDPVVTLVLLLLLGAVGGHQFYLGKIGKGFLYLFTGGLFGIGIFVDLIKLLTGKLRDEYGRKVKF